MNSHRAWTLVQLWSLLIVATSLCAAATKLSISPVSPRQLSNSSLQFTATFGKLDVTKLVKWTSSSTTVATIRHGGEANLRGTGVATITATLLTLRASTKLSVTAAVSPVFSAQPTDTNVSAVIDAGGGVQVHLLDNLGDPLPNQSVTISIGTNPPSTGTLSGALSQVTNMSGIATFPDLKIDWLGTGYTLVASSSPSSGAVSGTSAAFNELRVGDACLGPDTPACQGACSDADGDGLNDAWETAGGVDLNGDGAITDSTHDLLLAGADPNKPDIFVQYDWMDYGMPGNACSHDADCTGLGFGHSGETCSGPQLIPTAPASCRYSCNADSDCTSRGASHTGEICSSNSCVHTHDPSVTSPSALQAVVDRFAAHGINLHLVRGRAQAHSTVLSFRLLTDPQYPINVMSDSCEGGSVASGDAGPGKYAESFYDLKEKGSLDTYNIAYHYAIFGHYGSCDTSGHCLSCLAALNPDGSPKNAPSVGESGIAEVSGNDFIVSLGNQIQDLGLPDDVLKDGGTFMHELGHNLGLHHGGGIDTPCQDDSQCKSGNTCTQTAVGKYCLESDDTNWKPNYLTVMNYRFQFAGIASAAQVGSNQGISCTLDTDCPEANYCSVVGHVCARLDFSSQTLPTGGNTPGYLDESNTNGHLGLNELAGLGSGTADLSSYNSAECPLGTGIATDGPVDWNGDGELDTSVSADTNAVDHSCGTLFPILTGSTDWPELSGTLFTYKFQCTPFGGAGGDIRYKPVVPRLNGGKALRTPPIRYFSGGELSPQMAMDAHLLFPIRSAKIIIRPGCGVPALSPGQPGNVIVALLGDTTFDVNEVDRNSLRFAGAPVLGVATRDVDRDGNLDLLLTFDSAQLKLSPHATLARLSGWLKNSQAFWGEDVIRIVPSLTAEGASCQ